MSTWISKFVLSNCAVLCLLANLSITLCQAQDVGLAQSGANAEGSTKGEDLASYVLKPQDVLSISFALTPEYNETVTVMTDGYINLQFVNALYVKGLTVAQATSAVKATYGGVLRDPIVSINVKNFQLPYFTVIGQVNHPGKFDLRQRTSLPEGLAMAGGFNSGAKTQVLLIRHSSPEKAEIIPFAMNDFIKGKPSAAEPVELRAGDMIFVPEKLITKFKKYINYGSIGGVNAATVY
jgi:polysaccharide biosynthesis/export protein